MFTIGFALLSHAPDDNTHSEIPLQLRWSAALSSLPFRSWNLLPSRGDTELGTCNDLFLVVLFSGRDHFTIPLIHAVVSLVLPFVKLDYS